MKIAPFRILVVAALSSELVGAFLTATPPSPPWGARSGIVTTIQPTSTSARFLSDNQKPSFDITDITSRADRIRQELLSYDVSKVVENTKGEVGKRGEVYFLAQGALIVSILLGGVPVVGEPLQAVLGPLLLLSGLLVGVLSVVDLGSDSLSPFPKPPTSGSLKTTGVYAQMRHPMYTALMTVMLGLSLVTNSADRLLLTGFLYYLLEVKSDKEEIFLNEQYGSDYAAYQVRFYLKSDPCL